jgi:hypothetical protein
MARFLTLDLMIRSQSAGADVAVNRGCVLVHSAGCDNVESRVPVRAEDMVRWKTARCLNGALDARRAARIVSGDIFFVCCVG